MYIMSVHKQRWFSCFVRYQNKHFQDFKNNHGLNLNYFRAIRFYLFYHDTAVKSILWKNAEYYRNIICYNIKPLLTLWKM